MRFLGAGLLAAALIVSCGDEPPTGPSPPVLGVTAVTILGPASIPPGGSAQYTAMVKLSDGTEKAATTARWIVPIDGSSPRRLAIDLPFPSDGPVMHQAAAMHPDGRRIAFVTGTPRPREIRLLEDFLPAPTGRR